MDLGKVRGETTPHYKTTLKPFLDLVSSLKKSLSLSIPLLRNFAAFCTDDTKTINSTEGILNKRIDRRYLRLCRIQDNLGGLDFKKASAGASIEDFVFSQIDFSRYREIKEKTFKLLFREGLEDFDDAFYKKIFGHEKKEIQSVISLNYKEANGFYRLQRENPLILSVMQNLETSLESLPLFTAGEIRGELKELLDFIGKSGKIQNTELLYPLLVYCLNGALITHDDGMTTKLFISPQGDLAGTFRPKDKPWTRTLIPRELIQWN